MSPHLLIRARPGAPGGPNSKTLTPSKNNPAERKREPKRKHTLTVSGFARPLRRLPKTFSGHAA
jgi:hypothetical protein